MNNSIDLKNKVVLVTGGSQGIGSAICTAMAARGANVVINYCSHKEGAENLAISLENEYGVKVLPIGADISNEQDVEKCVFIH